MKNETETVLMIHEVLSKTGLSRSSLYRLIEIGKFPMSTKRGGRVTWSSASVDAWVMERTAACEAEANAEARIDQAYQDGHHAASIEASREHSAFFFTMEKVGDRLRFLSDSLDCVSRLGSPRTDEWWAAYTRSAARELREVLMAMPSSYAGLAEFQPLGQTAGADEEPLPRG